MRRGRDRGRRGVRRAARVRVLYTPRTRTGQRPRAPRLGSGPRGPSGTPSESDVSPPTDNRPFFFQSARPGQVFSKRWSRGEWRRTNLGTLVLFRRRRDQRARGGALHPRPARAGAPPRARDARGLAFLLYFAALGTGFIVVEVVLVQKCVLFLGHPVYALTVVLFAVLLWSGVGSWPRRARERRKTPRGPCARCCWPSRASSCSRPSRLAPIFYGLVQLCDTAADPDHRAGARPLGLALGMPMPTGIRLLAGRAPESSSRGPGA